MTNPYDPRWASGQPPSDPVLPVASTNGQPAPVPSLTFLEGTSQPSQPSDPEPNPGIGREHHTPKHSQSSKGPLGIVGHPTCSATSKRSGLPCQCYPMQGGTVCSTHGGMAGQVKAKAAARQALAKVEAEVRAALATESFVGVLNPLEFMSQLLAEARSGKNVLGGMVNDLEGRLRYEAHGAGTEQTRAEVILYERALDRCAKFADMLIRSGFENRKLLLEEYLVKARVAILGPFMDDLMDALRDELIAVGADATKDDFPKV